MAKPEDIEPIVCHFYRAILADGDLRPFFMGVEMDTQIRKMTSAMLVLLDRKPVDASALASAHASSVSKGLSDRHFDQVWSHLRNSLRANGVSDEVIEYLRGRIESLRVPILGQVG